MTASITHNVPKNMKSRLAESYDAIATTYNNWTTSKSTALRIHYLSKLLTKLRTTTSPPTHIIELGCGHGLPVLDHILTTIPTTHLTANDISTTQLALAKQNLAKHAPERITFLQTDMMSLTFPPASLDAVVGMYSLIHLPREEQTELLHRILKWLKPGGMLLANFSAKELPGAINDHWLHEEGWMFWSGWGAEGMVERLREVGLELLVSEEIDEEGDARFLWVLGRK
ncbi:hypothetical protein HDV00_009137 [Rhizophlyctis rosea]|nr:hypothetical protein HDV00_009137 [Rhizophlyctis rosea]